MPRRLFRRSHRNAALTRARSLVLVVTAMTMITTPASGAWAADPPRTATPWSNGTMGSVGGHVGRIDTASTPPRAENAPTGVADGTDATDRSSTAGTTAPSTTAAPSTSASAGDQPPVSVPDQLTDPTYGAVLAVEARTGVPDGAALTPMSGNLTIATPGYVLQNVDLQGCLVIQASDVVVRNSRITCGSPQGLAAVQTSSGAYRFLIEDSEVDGAGRAQIGIGFSNVTARRVEIRNTGDGLRASWRVTLEDSWVHSMVRLGDLHPDAVQTTGGTGIVIRGNTLDPMSGDTGDFMNAAIMLGSETSSSGLNDVLVENNVLDGGNYTVNMRGDTVFTNVVFRNNVFGVTARYGPFQAPTGIGLEGANVLQTTGAAVRINPAR